MEEKMNSRKNYRLILGVFTLTVALSAYRTGQLASGQQLNAIPAQLRIADGSGPVPPLPPDSMLIVDGSGPVPPIPPPEASIPLNSPVLIADGSGPVPPLPPDSMLIVDGSGPVPPIPPNNIVNIVTV
jgi:hypothetical protein